MITEIEKGIYLDKMILEKISKCDGIIFDCDGVLIDVTKSYELAINNTIQYMLKKMNIDSIQIDSEIIHKFKSTGGFNNEVDLVYGIILAIVAANKMNHNKHEFILKVIENSDYTGVSSTETYLQKLTDISDVIAMLNYHKPHTENTLYQTFDQIFYGPALYKKIYKKSSEFAEPGLIENDSLIINKKLLDEIKNKISKIGMVTGRGALSARHSLGILLDKFDLENSVFLEDEPKELAKPNPESLIRSIRGMNCEYGIYVGDSMEDLIMAKEANVIFCGIIDSKEKLKLFKNNDIQLAIESIHLLPKVLNLE